MTQQLTMPSGKIKASYSSLWSPRRLMQRASHAFRSSKSRCKKKKTKEGDNSVFVTSQGFDAFSESETASIQSFDEHLYIELSKPKYICQERHNDVERIIQEEVETVKETIHEEVTIVLVEEPKKLFMPPVVVVEEAILVEEMIKNLDGIMTPSLKEMRFQGSKVKTAMERRSEEEQPRKKEVVKSNDVIEETRSKLLEKRHSKVKALVGAFETIMDAKHDTKPL